MIIHLHNVVKRPQRRSRRPRHHLAGALSPGSSHRPSLSLHRPENSYNPSSLPQERTSTAALATTDTTISSGFPMARRSGHATARASSTFSAPHQSSGRWHYPTAPRFSISPISPSSPRGSTFDAAAASSKQVGSPLLISIHIIPLRSPYQSPPASLHPPRWRDSHRPQAYISIILPGSHFPFPLRWLCPSFSLT